MKPRPSQVPDPERAAVSFPPRLKLTVELDKDLQPALPGPAVSNSPFTTAQADELVAKDEEFIMRPWTHPAGEPVIVAKAKDCVVTDVHGKDYLDLTAGYFVNAAGHCHPRIVEA